MGRELQQSYCDPTDGAKGWIQRLEGEGNGELLLKGYKVSVMQDEEVWETCSQQGRITLLYCKLKNG